MTQKQYQDLLNNLEAEIRERYGFPESIADIIVGKADIEKHAYCYEEVETYAYDLADFTQDIINFYNESNQ